MDETDAGQVLATFARISWVTLADVVRREWIWLEANTVFAFVILTGRRLWIHHRDHRRSFAEFTGVFLRAFAVIIVDAIHANATILAHVILAVINILGAIGSAVARSAFA